MNPSNIEQWILLVREVIDVQRLEWAPSLIPELIANFEEHPNPADCVGVDYKAIYLYISALMDVSYICFFYNFIYLLYYYLNSCPGPHSQAARST